MAEAEEFYNAKVRLEQELTRSWSDKVENYARLCWRLGHFWQPLAFIRQHAPKPPDEVTLGAYMHLLLGTGYLQQTRAWAAKAGAEPAKHPYIHEQHLRLAVLLADRQAPDGTWTNCHSSVEILSETLAIIEDPIPNRRPDYLFHAWTSATQVSESALDLAYLFGHANAHAHGLDFLSEWHDRAPSDPGIAAAYAWLLVALKDSPRCREICERMASQGFHSTLFKYFPWVAGEAIEGDVFRTLDGVLKEEPLCANCASIWLQHCGPYSLRALQLANRVAKSAFPAMRFGWKGLK